MSFELTFMGGCADVVGRRSVVRRRLPNAFIRTTFESCSVFDDRSLGDALRNGSIVLDRRTILRMFDVPNGRNEDFAAWGLKQHAVVRIWHYQRSLFVHFLTAIN